MQSFPSSPSFSAPKMDPLPEGWSGLLVLAGAGEGQAVQGTGSFFFLEDLPLVKAPDQI